jgi:molecular chaperone GrpE (heat shock protein)
MLNLFHRKAPASTHDVPVAAPAHTGGAASPRPAQEETDAISVAPPGPVTAQRSWKQRALDDFSTWLDALPDEPGEEMAAQGMAADEDADMATLVGEVTTLRQEMKLLGRSSGRLAHTVEEATGEMLGQLGPLGDAVRQSSRDARQAAARTATQPLLLELGDMRDAIASVLQACGDGPRPWYHPAFLALSRGESATKEALAILLARIDGALQRHGLRPVAATGDCFETACMTAMGTSSAGRVAGNQVSDIVQQGYMSGNELLRPARVIVEKTL